ncbi:Abi family protein [Tamilnaduibacter salinus]|uniref:Abi family protein n=1 Tax=Tamilnaduibacter salinus TaxID=1484056 RepID=UPI000BABD899
MTDFHKPAHSIDEQIQTLRDRGLNVPDADRARHFLANISYFRLSAYTRPFYQPNRAEHRFLQGSRFDDVLNGRWLCSIVTRRYPDRTWASRQPGATSRSGVTPC